MYTVHCTLHTVQCTVLRILDKGITQYDIIEVLIFDYYSPLDVFNHKHLLDISPRLANPLTSWELGLTASLQQSPYIQQSWSQKQLWFKKSLKLVFFCTNEEPGAWAYLDSGGWSNVEHRPLDLQVSCTAITATPHQATNNPITCSEPATPDAGMPGCFFCGPKCEVRNTRNE